jgi:hypothetical protein
MFFLGLLLSPSRFFCLSGLSAQPNTRKIVIGLLDAGERAEGWDAFRQQLRELGYVEGRNVSFRTALREGKAGGAPGFGE